MNINTLFFFLCFVSIDAHSLFASNGEEEDSSKYNSFFRDKTCAEFLKTYLKSDKQLGLDPSPQSTHSMQTIVNGGIHIHLHNPVFHINCNDIKDIIINGNGQVTSNRNGSVTRNEN